MDKSPAVLKISLTETDNFLRCVRDEIFLSCAECNHPELSDALSDQVDDF